MKPILIIKTGSVKNEFLSAHQDFDEMIIKNAGIDAADVQVVQIFQGEILPDPDEVSGAIITGSVAMVTDRELWSVYSEQWIKKASKRGLPILGICYGHQLIAQALGGEVVFHPDGYELGTVPITLNEDGVEDELLGVLPKSFLGQVIHSQTVRQLPPGAINLASNDFESNHAFRYGWNVWGVQFHPEFTAAFMRDFITQEGKGLKKTAKELAAIQASLQENEFGKMLLENFCDICTDPIM
jgi:GMP synthase (glutamine-hydrolysing)